MKYKLAITSFILSILSWLLFIIYSFPPFRNLGVENINGSRIVHFSPINLAIILSLILFFNILLALFSLYKAKEYSLKGKGFATASLVISSLFILLTILMLILLPYALAGMVA